MKPRNPLMTFYILLHAPTPLKGEILADTAGAVAEEVVGVFEGGEGWGEGWVCGRGFRGGGEGEDLVDEVVEGSLLRGIAPLSIEKRCCIVDFGDSPSMSPDPSRPAVKADPTQQHSDDTSSPSLPDPLFPLLLLLLLSIQLSTSYYSPDPHHTT